MVCYFINIKSLCTLILYNENVTLFYFLSQLYNNVQLVYTVFIQWDQMWSDPLFHMYLGYVDKILNQLKWQLKYWFFVCKPIPVTKMNQ